VETLAELPFIGDQVVCLRHDQARQVGWFAYCALLDWPTCSSSDPIRWRPRADPGQKRDTGDRITAQRD